MQILPLKKYVHGKPKNTGSSFISVYNLEKKNWDLFNNNSISYFYY